MYGEMMYMAMKSSIKTDDANRRYILNNPLKTIYIMEAIYAAVTDKININNGNSFLKYVNNTLAIVGIGIWLLNLFVENTYM